MDDGQVTVKNRGNGCFPCTSHSQRIRFAYATDGTSQTFLLGEQSHNGLPTDERQVWSDQEAALSTTDNSPVGTDSEEDTFGSNHTGGAHFALLDGSVRFVAKTDDMLFNTIYHAAATRAGGESQTIISRP